MLRAALLLTISNVFMTFAGVPAAQLKTLQEVITFTIFVVFATGYLREPLRWHTAVGLVLILAGATFVFAPWVPAAD